MFKKNTAAGFGFGLVNAATGAALAGATVTAKVSKDGAAQAAASGAVSDLGNGQYWFAGAAADFNGDTCSFFFTAASAIPLERSVRTVTKLVAELVDAPAPDNATIANIYAAIDTEVAAIKAKTDAMPAFPANFSALAITAGGAVTAGTVQDKSGYALAQAFPANFAALAITAGGAVTAGTVQDKSGYSLLAAEHTSFQTDVGAALTSQGYTTVRAPKLDQLDVPISSRLSAAGYTAPDNAGIGNAVAQATAAASWAATAASQATTAANNSSTILNRLGVWTGSGINTILGAFKALMHKASAQPSDLAGAYAPATDALEAIRDQGDAAWGGGGGGGGGATAQQIWTYAGPEGRTLTLWPVRVEVVGPVITAKSLALVRGDAYKAALGNAIELISDSWPDLTTAVVKLTIQHRATGAKPIDAKSGVVVTPTGTKQVRFELDSAETAVLCPDGQFGNVYDFDVQATIGADKVTLTLGACTVAQDHTT